MIKKRILKPLVRKHIMQPPILACVDSTGREVEEEEGGGGGAGEAMIGD